MSVRVLYKFLLFSCILFLYFIVYRAMGRALYNYVVAMENRRDTVAVSKTLSKLRQIERQRDNEVESFPRTARQSTTNWQKVKLHIKYECLYS